MLLSAKIRQTILRYSSNRIAGFDSNKLSWKTSWILSSTWFTMLYVMIKNRLRRHTDIYIYIYIGLCQTGIDYTDYSPADEYDLLRITLGLPPISAQLIAVHVVCGDCWEGPGWYRYKLGEVEAPLPQKMMSFCSGRLLIYVHPCFYIA